MAKARNWILIILAIIGGLVVCLIAAAGFGTYMIMQRVKTEPATATSAVKTFDAQRTEFKGQTPLVTFDDLENPETVTKKIAALPVGAAPATDLHILVWAPDSQRTVNISLPFWLLKMGKRKVDIGSAEGFDFERFNVDIAQLERIGPRLFADFEKPGGERVLIWTK